MRTVLVGVLLILTAALIRILPHPVNVTPLAAMALAGGVYLDRRYALIIPILAMIVSDAIIGFHATIPFVYGAFFFIGVIGLWLRSHKSFGFILGGTIASSVLFFVVTNFGVWLTGGGWNYPRTTAGLIECYAMAIPFFRNTLVGDLVSVGILFGAFELSRRRVGATERARVRV
jgi:hypothetical protein